MKKNEKHEIIGSFKLFRGLTENNLSAIAQIARRKEYDRLQTIFSEGDSSHGFFIISLGKVKIYKISATGKEQILHLMGPGEPFGEVPVFRKTPYPAFAEAVEKTTVFYFPAEQFRKLLIDNTSIALEMLAVLSQRLHTFTMLIDDLSLKEVPARIARYLLEQIPSNSITHSINLKIPKSQLAALIGTIPETLSRAFSKLIQAGIINIEGATVMILQRDVLEELSRSGKIV